MAYQAKYVLSTALAYITVRRQAVRILNYTSELVTGIEPATFGPAVRRSNHYEVFLSYGTHFVFYYEGGMRLSQGDFWNYPMGVIRNLNPAPFQISNRSNSSLRQPPPFFFKLLKELFCFRDAKLCFGQRNLSA